MTYEEALKDLLWRLNDVREELLNNHYCDEWSTAFINLTTAIKVTEKRLSEV